MNKVSMMLKRDNGLNQLEISGDYQAIKSGVFFITQKYYCKDFIFYIQNPTKETLATLLHVFQENNLEISNNIERELFGEMYRELNLSDEMPLDSDQIKNIYDIVRLGKSVLADEYGTGKTHTMISLVISLNKKATYIAPAHAFYQVKEIIKRYFGENSEQEKLFDFIDIKKKTEKLPKNEVLIVDEANLLISKKSLCKLLGKDSSKIRVFLIPREKIHEDQYPTILNALGVIKTKTMSQKEMGLLIHNHLIFRRETAFPESRNLMIQCSKRSVDLIEKMIQEPTGKNLQIIRDLIVTEKINQTIIEIKNLINSTDKSVAVISKRKAVTDVLLENLPMFKKYTPGKENEKYLILDSSKFDESIEIPIKIVVNVEMVLKKEEGSSSIYRFFRIARKQTDVVLINLLNDNPLDLIIAESPLFASNAAQLNYIKEKLKESLEKKVA